jgi:hypothetical protein
MSNATQEFAPPRRRRGTDVAPRAAVHPLSRSLSMSIATHRLLARSALVAALLLGSTSLVSAQSVTVRGKVENVSSVFLLQCTPCQLVSGTININALVGLQIEAKGTVTGTNTVSITSATLVNDFLEITGSTQLGGVMKLEITGAPGRVEQIHFALGNAFKVVKGMGWFLDFATSNQVLEAVIPGTGKLEISGTLPNNPVYDGLDIFIQHTWFDLGIAGKIGNSDCAMLHI